MVSKQGIFGMNMRNKKWDSASKTRSNFRLFETAAEKFSKAVVAQDWKTARELGEIILNVDISGFHLNEIEKYNKAISRLRNTIKTLPPATPA